VTYTNETPVQRAQRLATTAALRYRRRAGAWFELEDAESEAKVCALEAYVTFDPQRGTPEGVYVWKAALYGARRYVLKWSAPVSTEHDLRNLRHLQRASLTGDAPSMEEGVDIELQTRGERTEARTVEARDFARSRNANLHGASARSTESAGFQERKELVALNAHHNPEELAEEHVFANAVRARLAALLGEVGRDFALGVFTQEWSPEEIAVAHNKEPEDIYRLRQKVRGILRRDQTLFALWKERVGEHDAGTDDTEE
jgi:hypothetical protein